MADQGRSRAEWNDKLAKTLHLNLLCFIDARLFGQKCPKNHNALTVRLKVFFCFFLLCVCTKTEKLLSAEADLFQDNAAYPVHFHISSCETLRDGGKVGEGKKKKQRWTNYWRTYYFTTFEFAEPGPWDFLGPGRYSDLRTTKCINNIQP